MLHHGKAHSSLSLEPWSYNNSFDYNLFQSEIKLHRIVNIGPSEVKDWIVATLTR